MFSSFILSVLSSKALEKLIEYLGGRSDAQSLKTLELIKAEVAMRSNAKEVRLATATFWEMRLFTAIVLGIFVTHLLLIALDTFTTNTRFEIVGWDVPRFPSWIEEWEGPIILSLFGLSVVGRVLTASVTVLDRIFGLFGGKK